MPKADRHTRSPIERKTPEEEAQIQAGIDADPDNPEMSAADFAAARPAAEVVPEIVEEYRRRLREQK
ncbi:hypothetical protein [Roseomonas elaeocarpi]|uniref:Uncharacterized protein n=1 Tax=Roseomonas elaeocarpi TaxID=907779 RepID=A0ABV6JZB9_9PROT